MDHRISLKKSLPLLLLIGSLSAVYLSTLAPGLTWANDGSDGGDLITAAATGGIAHPTGYPLYLLLARGFQWLPWGSLAFRTNLMSAAFAVLAALLIYEILRRSTASQVSAWAGGLAFGLAPLVWSQAVVTEVYTLQACLTAWVLYLYARPNPSADKARKRLDCWRGLGLGLALCNQVSAILFLPVALVLGSFQADSEAEGTTEPGGAWSRPVRFDGAALRRQLLSLGLGMSLYLLIPLRAMTDPPVNWGNAITPARLWWLVSGGLYQSYYLPFDPAGVWQRLQYFAGFLIRQFGLPGLVLGVTGLVLFGRGSRLYILTAWIALVSLGFAVLYGSNDSYLYLIPLLVAFCIWVGLGLAGLCAEWKRWSPALRILLALFVTVYLAARSVAFVPQVDASDDARAQAFGSEVLSTAPQNAILFASGDRAVFALWYFHFALGQRTDVAVLAEDLLHFDWYQETLRTTYPSLFVPGPFPWPESVRKANSDRPVCYVSYSVATDMTCLKPIAEP